MSETAPAAASDAGGSASAARSPKSAKGEKKRGLFARIGLFWRQVVAELVKVTVLPTVRGARFRVADVRIEPADTP